VSGGEGSTWRRKDPRLLLSEFATKCKGSGGAISKREMREEVRVVREVRGMGIGVRERAHTWRGRGPKHT
jgi:hypothetical protein